MQASVVLGQDFYGVPKKARLLEAGFHVVAVG
jgi:hypothetical protein